MRKKSIPGIIVLLALVPFAAYGAYAQDEEAQSYNILCDHYEKWIPDVKVSASSADAYESSLVWTGSEYGLSWCDSRDQNFEVYFVRLDSSGNKIGSDIRITNASDDCAYQTLAWTGTGYGLSWSDHRDGNWEIYFARLDASGGKIGSDVRVTSDSADSYDPSLAWTGTEYALSWEDYRDGNWEIYFARLDASGGKIGSDVRVTADSNDAYGSALAWTGAEYGLSWVDNRDGNWEIYFTRISPSGSKSGSDMRVTNNSLNSYGSSLVWTGTEYGVTWYDYRDGNWEVYFARLDQSGNKIGSDIRVTNADDDSLYSVVAWTGTEYGISWYDFRDGNWEIYFARLDASGNKIGSDIRVTDDSSNSGYPSLALAGSEFGIAWEDQREGNVAIYFAALKCCSAEFDNDGDGWCWSDCNDSNSAIHPEAVELCNGIDDNCSGNVDDVCSTFDVNDDNIIDGVELAWLGRAFGASSSTPENEWWYRVDFDHNGQVEGGDLSILGSVDVWGKSTSECSYTCP